MPNEEISSRRTLRAVFLIAGAALYRPLVFWAENAWDLANPEQVFLIPGMALVIGILLFRILTSAGLPVLPTAFTLAGVLLVLFQFHSLPWLSGGLWLAVVLGLGALAHSASPKSLDRMATIALAILILAPVLQVAIQHVTHRHSYPLTSLADPVPAKLTGAVEDVLVVVVDSYPMLTVAEDWFGHNPSPLVRSLLKAGFEVENVAWSHNTYTGLAVPSILQLEQVADASPKGAWGNRRTSYDITGGNNFVARSLQNAGFSHTHIESGWDGGACKQADMCLRATWLDEATWNLLRPSALGSLLESRYGSMEVPNTIRAVDHITGLAVFGDGRHDFVYAHLMLPHPPYVVDESCQVLPPTTRAHSGELARLLGQLTCVDSLLMRIAAKVKDTTAVLIAGDHGTAMRGQINATPSDWSDSDIAERLGVLLAYKLPDGCPGPSSPTNLYAMRAIMECAVDVNLPSDPSGFLLGANQPVWVEADRVAAISRLLETGALAGLAK